MTVLEEEKTGSGFGVQGSEGESAHFSSLNPEPRTLNPPSRFARYFTRSGWVHALLLLFAWLFFFPFFWMFATSMKTDEELSQTDLLPEFAHFHPTSPYVRTAIEPVKPADVSHARWNQVLPRLQELARERIAAYQQMHEPEPSLDPINPEEHRIAASAALVNTAVAKIDKRHWDQDDKTLV